MRSFNGRWDGEYRVAGGCNCSVFDLFISILNRNNIFIMLSERTFHYYLTDANIEFSTVEWVFFNQVE